MSVKFERVSQLEWYLTMDAFNKSIEGNGGGKPFTLSGFVEFWNKIKLPTRIPATNAFQIYDPFSAELELCPNESFNIPLGITLPTPSFVINDQPELLFFIDRMQEGNGAILRVINTDKKASRHLTLEIGKPSLQVMVPSKNVQFRGEIIFGSSPGITLIPTMVPANDSLSEVTSRLYAAITDKDGKSFRVMYRTGDCTDAVKDVVANFDPFVILSCGGNPNKEIEAVYKEAAGESPIPNKPYPLPAMFGNVCVGGLG